MVNKFIYVITVVMVIVIGGMFAGCLSEGDLQSRSDQIKGIQDNQKAILNSQDIIIKGSVMNQGQINNKLDAILSNQREQTDLTRSLIYEIRKQTQAKTIPTRIDILVNRDGYNEISSFNNVDEARTYINGLK
jgi:hypothetical protein